MKLALAFTAGVFTTLYLRRLALEREDLAARIEPFLTKPQSTRLYTDEEIAAFGEEAVLRVRGLPDGEDM